MADYTNFKQVLQDRKGSDEKRLAFVRSWLTKTYGIDFEQNPEYFAELTRVHDHDNQPFHFGQVPYQTLIFTVAELVKVENNQWRIAVSFQQDGAGRVVLQPLGQQEEANRNALLKYITAVTVLPSAPQFAPEPEGQLLRFGPGNGSQYSNFETLNAPIEHEGDLRATQHPAQLPGFLTLPEEQITTGIPVDISGWLRRGEGADDAG